MSLLPVPELLEAAHIIPDANDMSDASVNNGICLSRIHHRAFDANLLGVDPDFKIRVSPRLLEISDGPMLEEALKGLDGKALQLPSNPKLRPSRDFVAIRYESFLRWQ